MGYHKNPISTASIHTSSSELYIFMGASEPRNLLNPVTAGYKIRRIHWPPFYLSRRKLNPVYQIRSDKLFWSLIELNWACTKNICHQSSSRNEHASSCVAHAAWESIVRSSRRAAFYFRKRSKPKTITTQLKTLWVVGQPMWSLFSTGVLLSKDYTYHSIL